MDRNREIRRFDTGGASRLGSRLVGTTLVVFGCFATVAATYAALFSPDQHETFDIVVGLLMAGGVLLVGVLAFFATPFSELSARARVTRKRIAQFAALVIALLGPASFATEAFNYTMSGRLDVLGLVMPLIASLAGILYLIRSRER